MKKTLALLLSAVLALSCSVPVLAAPAEQAGNVTDTPLVLLDSVLSQYDVTRLSDDEFQRMFAASPVVQSPVSPVITATATSSQDLMAKTYKGVDGFIQRMYDFILGRSASDGEVEYYSAPMREGSLTAGGLAYTFFNSDEYKARQLSDTEYITLLYQALLGRNPGESEIAYNLGEIKSVSHNAILIRIIESDEFAGLCDAYGVVTGAGTITLEKYMDLHGGTARFVERLYKEVHGRNASDDEVEERVRELIDGGSNAALMGFEFINSPEFKNRNLSDLDFVKMLYRTMLDRNAGDNEPEYYTTWLAEGVSRNYVYSCFINSPEFLSLCADYGVPTGGLKTTEVYDTTADPARFATRQYVEVLGRTSVTEEEIRFRADQLVNGTGAAQLTGDLFTSQEFRDRNLSDTDYITVLYRSLLNRDPAQSEIDFYLDMLSKGASRTYLLSSFLTSPEFNSLCASYNLQLGAVALPDVVPPSSTATSSFKTLEHGLDVSMYQGSINWSAVKAAGYDFVIVRATTYTGGLQVDPYFYEHVRGAKNAGLKVGAYVYTYSYSTDGVNNELNTLYAALAQIEKEGHKLEYPVFWDVEANTYTNQASVADLTTLAKYAMDSMRAKGYYGALYTYTNFANTRLDMDRLSGYDLWIAQYGPRVTYGGSYTMWQYTSGGSVPGISGNVDLNYSYKDYESEIKNGGWNHW